ncbi:hypothetical protein [Pseudomonas sp.]|uniref:hypothetical protein n=1 Tax=Pseudomonas sp. TaxID=306 RepID=UPI00261DE594|nr:hypothetical protein [Pseudomonas sp.]
MNSPNLPYYAATAYRADRIPRQQPSAERSWIKRFAKTRLPWGMAHEVAPDDFLIEAAPEDLRRVETGQHKKMEQLTLGTYVPAPYEHVDFHDRHNHENFRFSLWSKKSQFWVYLLVLGKGFFIILFPAILITFVVLGLSLKASWSDLFSGLFSGLFSWLLGVPLFCWALGAIVIYHFPHLWVKPSRGPIWEINRRTGLVTLFDYDNNGEYKKNGTIGELTAPFYEFDAYIATIPDRQGLSMNVLYIAHRYRDIVISFRPLLAPGEGQLCCALWDFIQNYMDTSRPLPDLPRYEQYRHLDPVTAQYDRKVGRNPRLWIDMDDTTFDQALYEMRGKIDEIDTFHRPNLMARYVEYVD